MINNKKLNVILKEIYGNQADEILSGINGLCNKYKTIKVLSTKKQTWVSENDSMLITYADMITENNTPGVKTLHCMLDKYIQDGISAVHLLPFYPYSSDDGFSIIDYRKVRNNVGDWNDIEELANDYDLMFDAVINHISSKSEWFQEYLGGNELYKNYFIECDDTLDYSKTTRPRDLPLLTEFDTAYGKRKVWTTFSADQIDLNFREYKVLLEVLDILLMYIACGARYIRLDAIGFIWKEIGTTSIHLKQTHQIIKIMRIVLEHMNENIILITETNTPHEENVSYFGDDYDEAHMVYQFPLPPLTLHAFLTKDSTVILDWIDKLENIEGNATYFNFLASHDGIGLRPLEGILDKEEINSIEKMVIERGGQISYRDTGDCSKCPYELNINYLDAICEAELDDDMKANKFMASQAILLSVKGIPGIYLHSLLGSRNDINGFKESGIKRSINREKLDKNSLFAELDDPLTLRSKVLSRYLLLLNIRKKNPAFSPNATQKSIYLDKRLFSIERYNRETNDKVRIIINLSDEKIMVPGGGENIIKKKILPENFEIEAYEVIWQLL
ncbi:MAG: sugar phosphorylase [Clostridiales bacterium]|nr:sugar phosphorylase [Clostridiales bacterium]